MVNVNSKLSAKVIEKTVESIGKSQEKVKPFSDEASPFKQLLNQMSNGEQFANALGVGNQRVSLPSSDINAISAQQIAVDSADLNVGLEKPKGIDKIVDMLSEVNKGQMQMESLVNQILYSEKRFSNQELLAVQAHVFHFAQMTELVVKAADQGVSSIKSVLGTNIQ